MASRRSAVFSVAFTLDKSKRRPSKRTQRYILNYNGCKNSPHKTAHKIIIQALNSPLSLRHFIRWPIMCTIG